MDLGLEKLCPYCRESGEIINPKFLEWSLNDRVGKQPDKIVMICPICNGSLVIPTEMGIDILELVDKYRYMND